MSSKKSLNSIENLRYSNKCINTFILFTFVGGALLFIPSEIIFWLFFLTIFYLIIINLKVNKKKDIKELSLVYFVTASIYGLFVVITHTSLVEDPQTDVFITIDSMTFNQAGMDVSQNKWSELIPFITSQYLYADYYLFSFLLGVIYKICIILNIQDPPLVSKLLNATVGAAPIAITYSCISLKIKNIPFKSILWFILFSPLIEISGTLMRDIYVAFFYTWAFYYVIIPKASHRTRKIILLAILCMLIRPENGIFLFSFVFIKYYNTIKTFSKTKRIILGSAIIVLLIIGLLIAIPIAQQVLSSYQDRDIAAASSGSFGVILKHLPIPLNIIIPGVFSQIMPFPFWFNLTRPFGGEYTLLSVFSSFYWLSIWSVVIFALIKHWRVLWGTDKNIILSLAIAILYILMTSYGEINVRRIMAVYPIVFVSYMVFKNYVRSSNRIKLAKAATTVLITLNLIYFMIK